MDYWTLSTQLPSPTDLAAAVSSRGGESNNPNSMIMPFKNSNTNPISNPPGHHSDQLTQHDGEWGNDDGIHIHGEECAFNTMTQMIEPTPIAPQSQLQIDPSMRLENWSTASSRTFLANLDAFHQSQPRHDNTRTSNVGTIGANNQHTSREEQGALLESTPMPFSFDRSQMMPANSHSFSSIDVAADPPDPPPKYDHALASSRSLMAGSYPHAACTSLSQPVVSSTSTSSSSSTPLLQHNRGNSAFALSLPCGSFPNTSITAGNESHDVIISTSNHMGGPASTPRVSVASSSSSLLSVPSSPAVAPVNGAHADTKTAEGDDDSDGRLGLSHVEKWHIRFKDLTAFKRVNGHCLVPLENYEHPPLAHWVKRQRCQYKLKVRGKKSTLTDDRQALLNDLGFVWDAHHAAWQVRLIQLRQFMQVEGHADVPTKYPANQSLAIWAKCQRRNYRLFQSKLRSNLTQDRIDDLDRLGFVWEAPKSDVADRTLAESRF